MNRHSNWRTEWNEGVLRRILTVLMGVGMLLAPCLQAIELPFLTYGPAFELELDPRAFRVGNTAGGLDGAAQTEH